MEGTGTVAGTHGRQHRVFWWKEALIVAVFYVVYSWTRNQFGSNRIAADGVPEQAFNNAERVIRLQRFIGLYHEETVQEIFLPYRWFIQFWNVYYGTAHFFVTLGVFILLYVKRADVFPQWRNTLAAMTALAIVGFAFFPLMPPRLLDAPCPQPETTFYGGACVDSELRPGPFDGTNGFGFVDTLSEFGGPWKFDSETVASVSNQYAAMPSMHIGWATWCAIAVWPLLRRRWVKIGVLLYPAATLFCIVVTGNHFWLDGVGGLVAFGFGGLIGLGLHRWNQNRLDRRYGPVGAPPASAHVEGFRHGHDDEDHHGDHRDHGDGNVDLVSPPASGVDVSSNLDEPDAVEPPQRPVGHDRPRPGEPTE